MELEWKTCTVGVPDHAAECVAETSFDLDMQLPDYMPDIHRILRCSVAPQIQSVSASGDRPTVEGSGSVRLLYCSEDGKTHVYEQSFPIRRAAPESMPTGNVRVTATADYVNCRASGQRRAAANGSVALRFRPEGVRSVVFPTASLSDELQTKVKPLSVCCMTACSEKLFAMSEVAELDSEAPISGILHSCTTVRADATKSVQDKVLVKGEATTEIQYLSASDGTTIVTFRHSMPINQVIEAVGVSETDTVDVSLRVASSVVTPKADSSGENSLAEITLQIGATVGCFAAVTPDFICDAYSTQADLKTKFQDTEMITDCIRWQESVAVREKANVAGADLQSVAMVCTDAVQSYCTVQDETITANCTVNIGLLGQNSEGMTVWTDQTVSFVCRKQIREGNASVVCFPTVCLTGCNVSLSSDGTLDVQAEGFIDGMIYTTESVRMLVSADAEPIAQTQTPAALTIYFADAGEPIWDIARRYRTTTDAVAAENDLTGDTVPEKRMLVIPLVG